MIRQIVLDEKKEELLRVAVDISGLIGLSGDGLPGEIIVDKKGSYPMIRIASGKTELKKENEDFVLTVALGQEKEAVELAAKEIFKYEDGAFESFEARKAPLGLFSTTGILKEDAKKERLLRFGVGIDENLIGDICLFVARAAMDTEEIELPLWAEPGKEKVKISAGSTNEIKLGDRIEISIASPDFLKRVLRSESLENGEDLLNAAWGKGGYEAELASGAAMSNEIYIEPTSETLRKEYERLFPEIKIRSFKDLKLRNEEKFEYPWERDVFIEKLEKLLEDKSRGKILRIYGAVSEPVEVRRAMVEQVKKYPGLADADCEIVNSYKQGFSWVEEYVIPKLKAAGADRVNIGWTPFMREGDEWTSEAGAVPTYTNVGLDDPEKWYDLPIRFLQELYPVDEVVARELGITKDDVDFPMLEGGFTYRVEGFKGDKLVYSDEYSAVVDEHPYINSFPEMGKVHPSTGYIRVVYEGDEEALVTFPTDLQNIWADYHRVLEKLGEKIKKEGYKAEDQPFFGQLKMDITVSEEDRRIGIREDSISSVDTFHEDIYFVGLDYFKVLGQKETGSFFDAPGLILPLITVKEGAPRMEISVYDHEASSAFAKVGGEKKSIEYAAPRLVGYREEDGKLYMLVDGDWSEKEMEFRRRILASGLSLLSELDIDGVIWKDLRLYVAKSKRVYNKKADKQLEVLDHEATESFISDLDPKEWKATTVGKSYMGLSLTKVERVRNEEFFASRFKKTMTRPTLYINARHHANEVSSTNSSFMLMDEIEKNPRLAQNINLVILPMENPDGSEIHKQLAKEHPNWIFHIARFNALGKEFGHEYFKKETMHTEALVFEKLFNQYLFDVYVDDHGVPSHEWCQQFSGYTAPSYKGFWMPRSLLYGYFWYPKGEEYEANYRLCKKMEDVVAEGINAIPEMHALNLEWKERFEKFAHKWLPEMFPTGYYKDMIFYWIPFDVDPTHRYASIRYPNVTVVGFTSEVADETAQGEYLQLCAEAHVAQNIAVLNFLGEQSFQEERIIGERDGNRVVRRKRRRNLHD